MESSGSGPRAQVGIAGRTGCGKSTLALALFRIVEPSAGSIVIDGIDVSRVGTFDLRSRIALVPQARLAHVLLELQRSAQIS